MSKSMSSSISNVSGSFWEGGSCEWRGAGLGDSGDLLIVLLWLTSNDEGQNRRDVGSRRTSRGK